MCPMNMLQPSWPPRQVNSNPASPSLGARPLIGKRSATPSAIPMDGRSSPRITAPRAGSARQCSKPSPRWNQPHFGWRTWQFVSCRDRAHHRTARGRRNRRGKYRTGRPTPTGRHQRTTPWLRRARVDAAPLTGGPTVNRVLHSLIGDPPTALGGGEQNDGTVCDPGGAISAAHPTPALLE
jgi:hypothetical protein